MLKWYEMPGGSVRFHRLPRKHGRLCKVKVLVAQSCLTLCYPMDCSPSRICRCNSPGKNTSEGCHFLLQGIFQTQRLNPGLPYCSRLFILWATKKAHGFPSGSVTFSCLLLLWLSLLFTLFYDYYWNNRIGYRNNLQIRCPITALSPELKVVRWEDYKSQLKERNIEG